MVVLLWITGVILYIFIALVLGMITQSKLCQKAGCRKGDCWSGHDEASIVLAILWPVSYILWGFGKVLLDSACALADKLSKE